MIDVIAYVATAVILAAYAWQAITDDSSKFNLANAVLWVPIALSALAHHAYPSLVVTLSFGIIGMAGLIRSRGVVTS